MKILLGTVAGLIAAGEGPLTVLDPVARLGAVGVLGAALLYHATHVDPNWDWDMIQQAKIGRHVFYGRK